MISASKHHSANSVKFKLDKGSFKYNGIQKLNEASLSSSTKQVKDSGTKKFNYFLMKISNGKVRNINEMNEDDLCDI